MKSNWEPGVSKEEVHALDSWVRDCHEERDMLELRSLLGVVKVPGAVDGQERTLTVHLVSDAVAVWSLERGLGVCSQLSACRADARSSRERIEADTAENMWHHRLSSP
jgi:hypothetical protein